MARHALVVALGMAALACTDGTGPDRAILDFEITGVAQQPNDQWLVDFRIVNEGEADVYLPRCDEVLTGLEHWTGSEWRALSFEACLAVFDQSAYLLTVGNVVEGQRTLVVPGRYRLHVRFGLPGSGSFDKIATTGPIDIP